MNAQFTPVTVTAETLQRLAKEKDYSSLLALYMACVEVTTWQNGNNIKASRSFMMKRLGWGKARLISTKAKLIEMGLISNVIRRNKDGTVAGHYLLVKHVIHVPSQPDGGFDGQVVSRPPSTNDLKLSTNNLNTSTAKLEMEKEYLSSLNRITKRSFRVLPRGSRATTKAFSLVEFETALTKLSKDEWHRDRLSGLSSDYLMRASTIDRWLTADSDAPSRGFA